MKVALPVLLCAVVASPASFADTETIHLTCELKITTQPPYGESKHSHETVVVDMLFDAATGFKAIRIHSVAIPVGVANKKGGAVTSFVDNSNANHWDISNRRDRTKVASDESAAIDRSTGRITAHSVTTVGDASQRVEARGTCAKVHTSGRIGHLAQDGLRAAQQSGAFQVERKLSAAHNSMVAAMERKHSAKVDHSRAARHDHTATLLSLYVTPAASALARFLCGAVRRDDALRKP